MYNIIFIAGSTCKTRWNNIRDNYRKSLKKTETKSGQKKTNVKLYKYYEQLHFLKKYFNERPTVQSVEPEKENSDSETNEPRNTVSISPDIPIVASNEASIPSPSNVSTPSPQCVRTPTPSPSHVFYCITTVRPHTHTITKPCIHSITTITVVSIYYIYFKKGSTKCTPKPSSASSLMEYVLQNNQEKAERVEHPVDAFINSIAPTLKNLNQYYLNLAKTEIVTTVQKYEMKMMREQNVPLYPRDIATEPTNTNLTSQSILDSTGLANIVDPTQSYLQHSDVQQFVMNYTINE